MFSLWGMLNMQSVIKQEKQSRAIFSYVRKYLVELVIYSFEMSACSVLRSPVGGATSD